MERINRLCCGRTGWDTQGQILERPTKDQGPQHSDWRPPLHWSQRGARLPPSPTLCRVQRIVGDTMSGHNTMGTQAGPPARDEACRLCAQGRRLLRSSTPVMSGVLSVCLPALRFLVLTLRTHRTMASLLVGSRDRLEDSQHRVLHGAADPLSEQSAGATSPSSAEPSCLPEVTRAGL